MAECLARPLLAERLAREKYEGGRMKDDTPAASLHPSSFIPHPFEEWWRGVRAQMEMAAVVGAEFQRADCAPRDTKGDGRLTVSDWVQAERYLGADALVAAGGPKLPVASSSLSVVSGQWSVVGRQLSMIRGQPQRTTDNEQRTISIELDAQGNENALSFSLRFNPAQWRFVAATLGSDAVGATLHVNDLAAKTGGVGVALALPAGRTLAAGTRQILAFRFAPLSGQSGRAAAIEFADFPVAREVVDAEAKVLPVSFAANPRKRALPD